MIIEIMLIILAMISVVVNTIVSVIIIKDILRDNKEGKITGKKLQKYIEQLQKEPLIPIDTGQKINITDKEFSDRCAQASDFAWGQAEAYKQAKQALEKDLQRQVITTINPNNPHPNDKLHYAYAMGQKQDQKENEQNDRI